LGIKKMKIITFYSDTHQKIFENFKNSYDSILSSSNHLKVLKIDQISNNGMYNSQGFDLTMVKKLDWILENLDLTSDELMMYVDCDVQFFNEIEVDMGSNDILFQHDYNKLFEYQWYNPNLTQIGKYPNYCAGMFICKQNIDVKNFFIFLRESLIRELNGKLHDQTLMNKILNDGYTKIKHDILDNQKYWTAAFSTNGEPWDGQDIDVPEKIIAHHANFTYGIENKLKLLNLVNKKIKKI